MTEPAHFPAEHVPVMSSEVMQLLSPRPGDLMIDATVGCGGHAESLCRAIAPDGMLIALDRDPNMLFLAAERLRPWRTRVRLVEAGFAELDRVLADTACGPADGILADLGFASHQVGDAARGFSYRLDGPLDMRMDRTGPTAADWINAAPEKEIADVLYEYGEERFSRRIARAIVRVRAHRRIERTGDLAGIVSRAYPRGPRRLHPARRSFQAIRIYLNREMAQLDRLLVIMPSVLKPGGRGTLISYHSLEDRRVKNAFLEGARHGLYERLTRKPLRPTRDEIETNPRSRSARLRAVCRTAGGAT